MAHDWTRWSSELVGEGFARFQTGLTQYNTTRLRPGLPEEADGSDLADEHLIGTAEVAFIEAQRKAIAPLVTDVPDEPDAFMQWFERLKQTGPGQGDPLFPSLAT